MTDGGCGTEVTNLPPGRQHPDLPFGRWWSMPLTLDTADPPRAWCRRDFVLHLRNKDGGGHVDPHLPEEGIRALEENGSLGWHIVDPMTGAMTMMNGPIPPSVRQIAWEVQATIEPIVGGSAAEG